MIVFDLNTNAGLVVNIVRPVKTINEIALLLEKWFGP